jgi:tripeptidyl-peptidase-1
MSCCTGDVCAYISRSNIHHAKQLQTLTTNFTGSLSGTSAATPVWAGIIAQLNGVRAAAGKPGLGFLAPFLYSLANDGGVGTDIVTGADNANPPCTQGFAPVKGYDCVTGLGTPLWSKLLAAVQALNKR